MECHRTIGFAAGGEAGSRLAEQLAMPTSPDTILRRIKSAREEPESQPRYVGVDDWAWKKGHNYGTILIDLERGRVIDILPGRDGSALKFWLLEHPGVQIITRDRWQAFAQAAAEGAPQATQIADRWHLLKNLREAIERVLERRHRSVRNSLLPISSSKPLGTSSPPDQGNASSPTEKPVLSARQAVWEAKRRRRTERYEQVRQRHAEGRSIRRIAAELNLSREAVARYLRQPRCPDWSGRKPLPSRLDKFRDQIDNRMASGQTNAAAIYRVLSNQGFPVSYFMVLRYIRRRRKITGNPPSSSAPSHSPQTPSSRQLAFAFIRRPECRSDEEESYIQALRGIEELQKPMKLTDQFAGMIRRTLRIPLADWLTDVERSPCSELRNFARGIRRDEAAVAAAMTESWSNGPVEGQVNRLKLIKRSMFGRAGFELLRARVRHKS